MGPLGCPETEARFLTTLHGRARSYLVICSFGELQRCAAASVGGCWCDAEAPPSAVVGADIGGKRSRSRPTIAVRWGLHWETMRHLNSNVCSGIQTLRVGLASREKKRSFCARGRRCNGALRPVATCELRLGNLLVS